MVEESRRNVGKHVFHEMLSLVSCFFSPFVDNLRGNLACFHTYRYTILDAPGHNAYVPNMIQVCDARFPSVSVRSEEQIGRVPPQPVVVEYSWLGGCFLPLSGPNAP